jgi:hypothetical protein
MKQEEKSVYDFKKGDVVTRIRPMTGESGLDYSLVGNSLLYEALRGPL